MLGLPGTALTYPEVPPRPQPPDGPAARYREEGHIASLAAVLHDAGLGEVDMLLEYEMPLTSKRLDAVLAGVHPVTGHPSYVVVELKRWTQVTCDENDPTLCYAESNARPVLHPVEQVRGYCQYLASLNGAIAAHPERLHGVVYLPHATEFGVGGLRRIEMSQYGQLFTSERRAAFVEYLKARLAPRAEPRAADELLAGEVASPKRLMDAVAQEVRERQQFILLDEQKLAYQTVFNAVHKARDSHHKEVVVVAGGPGTGKSVIALSLLGELYRRGVTTLHATGSASFTRTMRRVAGARKREGQLFKYFNSFSTAPENDVDVLICDEAHRIRETSANRYTPAAQRTGKPQIEELINVARVPVFFLDEHQVVRPGERGTVAEIRAAAAAKGIECRVVALDRQFRCAGSDAYVEWVTRLLGQKEGGPVAWDPDDRMRLLVVDTPQELEAFLVARRAQGYGARISAGYCWKWTTNVQPGQDLPADIVIGDWARPWNVYGERAVNGAPPAALWATDPAGFGQVGSVYSAQGFEYDWSGVIMGPDLVWRTDRWVADRAASRDPSFRRSTPDAEVDRLIRNTYKVLLTRGMVGTVVFSTDAETRQKLRELVPAGRAGGPGV
ncbi:DNA/RNA helicase domain-containing protein [Streptomyces sp. NPDC002446]